MKYYGDYANSSISMKNDEKLFSHLKKLSNLNVINTIIETGTFNGLGSTTFISTAFLNSKSLNTFYTIEVDYDHYKEAKSNLKRYPFVKCLYGCSVNLNSAINFITNDYPLNNHLEFPDVFIDDINNPVEFYLNEVKGKLFDKNISFFNRLTRPKRKFDLLESLHNKINENEIVLFVLDSAGGIGFLEFNTVLNLMKNKEYYILLDDIHHLKHFRGRAELNKNVDFDVIDQSMDNGWILAYHKKK